jgi:anti-anti-sigma factor
MPISHEDHSETLRRIRLTGRLDLSGIEDVAAAFTELCAGRQLRVVVDLSGVSFLVSYAIRELITNAKALHQRGGRMVIATGTNATVSRTLATTGIDLLIPTFADIALAEAAALE